MVDVSTSEPNSRQSIVRSDGVTPSERYLKRLCDRTFLSLWSYPGVFRDQGKHDVRGDGKEVCDLLVVFGKHIIIFSDKDYRFGDSGNLEVDWTRWYKKTILKSAEQVWGAERWLRTYPDRIFLDKQCTIPFPIALPDIHNAMFHRVVVAHDGSHRCRRLLGGSGSLMVDSSLVGDAHFKRPFHVGQVNPSKGYVHVFDDTTLDVVMRTLDTITDFTSYLEKKEQFLTENVVLAAGEEELLALYLAKTNKLGEHDFVLKVKPDVLSVAEGHWDNFLNSPERRAQVEYDRISYVWDEIVEKFNRHLLNGTQYFDTQLSVAEQEQAFRFLAREPRTRRRLLAGSLMEVLERSRNSTSAWEARVMEPSRQGDPYYLFVCLKHPEGVPDEKYREFRRGLLSDYCKVAKLEHPKAECILGIATEDIAAERRSEDLLLLNVSRWTADQQKEAREIQKRRGLLKRTQVFASREHEYPVRSDGTRLSTRLSRNSPCRCGSGKRFKRCCGVGVFDKRR